MKSVIIFIVNMMIMNKTNYCTNFENDDDDDDDDGGGGDGGGSFDIKAVVSILCTSVFQRYK